MRAAAVIAVFALTLAACGAEADKAAPTAEVVAGPAVAAALTGNDSNAPGKNTPGASRR